MKNQTLTLSLAANVILLALLAVVVHRPAPEPKPAPVVAAPVAPPPVVAAPAPVTKDVAGLIPQLRANHVSESLLARVADADFEERWQKRAEAMQAKFENGDIDEADLEKFNEQHDLEEEKEMRATLGNDSFVEWDKKRELFDVARLKLSDTETDDLYRMKKTLKEAQAELSRKLRDGEIDDADYNEQVAAAQKKYDDQMKTLLGEDRFAAWQNPDDGSTGSLKRSLRALNASDSQFTALLEAQRAWNARRMALDKKYADADGENDEYAAKLKELDASREQEYQKVLGTNGVAMLERQQDNNYQTLKRYANTWQLTDGEVDHLYSALRDYHKTVEEYQQRAQKLQDSGQQVDWAGVEENIQQFGRQTEQGLQIFLGADRFKKIRRNEIFNLASPNAE